VFSDKTLQSYLNEIAKYKTISREEEHRQAQLAQQGDTAAMNALIQANLKFVVKIATRYQNRGLTLSELISEGNIGLIRAVEKFDPDKDIKLISYAIWWIKQRIMLAISEKSTLIRIPMGKSSQANKLRAVQDKLFTKSGYVPSDDELGDAMELDEKTLQQLRSQMQDTLSIDEITTGSNNQDINLRDNLVDKDSPNPQQLYYRERLSEKLETAINRLEPREAEIIRTYYGLGKSGETKNFAQIAEGMGLSRERVRQIQKEALKKLMQNLQPSEEEYVNAFLDDYDYL